MDEIIKHIEKIRAQIALVKRLDKEHDDSMVLQKRLYNEWAAAGHDLNALKVQLEKLLTEGA